MALQTTQPEKRKGPVSTEEGEIRRLMEQYSEAVSNKDLEEIMSFYAPDVIAFDLMPHGPRGLGILSLPLSYDGNDRRRAKVRQLGAPNSVL